MPTRAQQAGLRVEDLPRPSLGQIIRRDKLDARRGRIGTDGAGEGCDRFEVCADLRGGCQLTGVRMGGTGERRITSLVDADVCVAQQRGDAYEVESSAPVTLHLPFAAGPDVVVSARIRKRGARDSWQRLPVRPDLAGNAVDIRIPAPNPAAQVFVKLDRRGLFLDRAGWREVPATPVN